MIEAFLRYFGVRTLEDIAKDLIKGREVILKEYPRGASGKLAFLPNVKVVQGEKPEEDWKIPYVEVEGPEGKLKFYGPVERVLEYGLAEVIAYASGALKPKEFPPLPAKVTLRTFVYPGLPCYFVLKTLGELLKVGNLDIEVIHVDKGKRLEMLYELGVKSVPTFAVGKERLHTGRLSAEELYELLKRRAMKELDRAWEELKKRYVKELDR